MLHLPSWKVVNASSSKLEDGTVGTRVFLRIAGVARANNDFDLADRMEALAKEKRKR